MVREHPEFPGREDCLVRGSEIEIVIVSMVPFPEDQKLYKVWVKFKEVETDAEKRTLNINRETDIDPNGDTDLLIPSAPSASTPGSLQHSDTLATAAKGKGKGKSKKGDGKAGPNTETKDPPKEKKEKTPAQQTKQARSQA